MIYLNLCDWICQSQMTDIGDYRIAFVAVYSVCPSVMNKDCTVLNTLG